MEKVEKFYLEIIAELKSLQSARLKQEKFLPVEVHVHEKYKETWFGFHTAKKKEKLNRKIENGYHKAINDCLKRVNEVYKETLKECSNN